MAAVEDLGKLAEDVESFSERAVRHLVTGLAGEIRPQIKRDLGGDSKMSGIGNARLSVSTKVKVVGDKVTGSVSAAPKKLAGPWSWMESGTKQHNTHHGTRWHPGTRGKRSWSKPVDRAVAALEREVAVMWDGMVR